MAAVKLDGVSKFFPGGVEAVRQLSLEVQDGEFLVLVGPSGCGKSTSLRLIAGLEEVSAGVISIGDRVVTDLEPRERDIAMVFQDYALYPHMSVTKNMAFGLRLRGLPRAAIDARVRAAAEALGITELLDRKPAALSGGQRQRVALGRAIVREPAVFLYDEPLSNLDARLRLAMRGELGRLHRRLQTTTIYVTHDQEEAMTLGDRIAVMAEGRLQQCDAPLAVYRAPVNRFVAAFLGTPAMNFFEGRPDPQDSSILELDGARLPLPLSLPQAPNHLVLGVRPESLVLSETPIDGGFELQVELVEPLGALMDLQLTLGARARFVARRPAGDWEEGQTVYGYMEAEGLHLFEPGPYGARLEARPD